MDPLPGQIPPHGTAEAKLFEYESGALTGTNRNGSKGLIAQTDGGTLLLDEIEDMHARQGTFPRPCRLLTH